MSNKSISFILGAHRSGTSALNGCFTLLGNYPGNNLIGANNANKKGYFEDQDTIDINNSILDSCSLRWDDTRPTPVFEDLEASLILQSEVAHKKLNRLFLISDNLSLKDPRMCRTLNFWAVVAARLKAKSNYIVILRDPESSIFSMMRRDGRTFMHSALLWYRYNLELFSQLHGKDYSCIKFDDFLNDPVNIILGLPNIHKEKGWEEKVRAFLDLSLAKDNYSSNRELDDIKGNDLKMMNLCRDAYKQLIETTHSVMWAKEKLDNLNMGYTFYNREIDNGLNKQFLDPNNTDYLEKKLKKERLKYQLAIYARKMKELL